MGKHYHHISIEERCEMARLQREGLSLCQIAASSSVPDSPGICGATDRTGEVMPAGSSPWVFSLGLLPGSPPLVLCSWVRHSCSTNRRLPSRPGSEGPPSLIGVWVSHSNWGLFVNLSGRPGNSKLVVAPLSAALDRLLPDRSLVANVSKGRVKRLRLRTPHNQSLRGEIARGVPCQV